MNINEILTGILDLVASVDPLLRILLAGIGMLLETSVFVGLVVPGDTIVLVASTAVSSPADFAGLFAAVVVGALLGESIGFALGRLLGPRIRVSRLGRRIGERNWQRAEGYVERRGGVAVFVSRFLPVLHSLVPLTAGMSAMSYSRFLRWTIPACLVWTGVWVGFGSLAATGYREVADELHIAGYLFVAAIVVFLAATALVKKLLERAELRRTDEQLADDDGSSDDTDGTAAA